MANGRTDMTEPNEPDKKNNETESTKDEAIIELEEEAAEEPKGNEETIDLVDAVEESPVEKQDDGVETGEQAPIELEEEITDGPTGDEEIIDLLEAAEESPKEDQDESIDIEKQESTEDGRIIDLTVKISEATQEIDDIDELDDDLIKESADFTDEFDTDAISDGVLDDDFADSLGIELDSQEDISGDLLEPDKITDEKIEAALERVIKKVFYEKIDRLLAEEIEKTVTREIEKLKKALLEDSPDGEK